MLFNAVPLLKFISISRLGLKFLAFKALFKGTRGKNVATVLAMMLNFAVPKRTFVFSTLNRITVGSKKYGVDRIFEQLFKREQEMIFELARSSPVQYYIIRTVNTFSMNI